MAPWQQSLRKNEEHTAIVAAGKLQTTSAAATTATVMNATAQETMMGATGMPSATESSFMPEAKRKQASVSEMLEYVKGLGIDPINEPDFLWIAEEAFNAPLPPGWSEHQDDEARIYFHNSATGESTWRHPMDDLFRDVVKYQREVHRCNGFWEVEDQIANVEDEIRKGLADWMELYDEHGEKFFYNRGTDESRFDDPRMAVYHELYARIKMVAKMKERHPKHAMNERPEEPTEADKERERLAREEEELYLKRVLKIQSMARMIIAKRKVRLARSHGVIQKGPQPLRGKLRLRMERVGEAGGHELVLAQTTAARRDKAATKIQARARGMLARNRFRPLVLHRAYLSRLMTKIQTRARVWLAKRRVARRRKERKLQAAVNIQRCWRGYRDRQYASALKAEKARYIKMKESILIIQCNIRKTLAYWEKRRRLIARNTTNTKVLQQFCKMYVARQLLVERMKVEEPIQAIFELTWDERARRVCPWSWTLMTAPWVGSRRTHGYSKAQGHGFLDLNWNENAENFMVIAARTIQAAVRGHRDRKRVKFLRSLAKYVLDDVDSRTWKLVERRRVSAILVQKTFRGWRIRRQMQAEISRLQEAARRYVSQVFLMYGVDDDTADDASTMIQKNWRGYLTRRHADRLREEELWPVKGWFEFVGTGPDHVQANAKFLLNPLFNDAKYFNAYGDRNAAKYALLALDGNVGVCVDHLEAMGGTLGTVEHLAVEGEQRPSSKISMAAKPKRSMSKLNPLAKVTAPPPAPEPKEDEQAEDVDADKVEEPVDGVDEEPPPATQPDEVADEAPAGPPVAKAKEEEEEEEEPDDAPKKPKKPPPRERAPLVADSPPSLAHTVLKKAPKKYKDIKEVDEEESPDEAPKKAVPKPPVKPKKRPAPPAGGKVKEVQAAGIRQPSPAEDGEPTDATMPAPIKRQTYGGTLQGGKFVRSAKDLDALSQEEKEQLLKDIEAEKERKKKMVKDKKKHHDEAKKQDDTEKMARYQAQMQKVTDDQDDRRREEKKKLKKWLKQKEAESKARRDRDSEVMQMLLAKEQQKSEAAKVLEEQRLQEREKRLRIAERQKKKLEDQLLASKQAVGRTTQLNAGPSVTSTGQPSSTLSPSYGSAPPSVGMQPSQMSPPMGAPPGSQGVPPYGGMQPGMPTQPGPGALPAVVPPVAAVPAGQRVLHRHIHHHVHYHEGDEQGEQPETGSPPFRAGKAPFINVDEQRQLEMASEARVRSQIETQGPDALGPPGPLAGFGGVDNFAETPHMRRPSSTGKLLPIDGLNRTQEAFQKSPSLPLLDPRGRPGLQNYGRSMEKAHQSYADSGRPRFVHAGPGKRHGGSIMSGGGVGPVPPP